MRYYQEFMQFWQATKSNPNRIIWKNSNKLERIYKEFGLDTQEKQDNYHKDKQLGMESRMDMAMETAQFFEVDERTKRLLILTDIPNDKDMLKLIRLPFSHIWIDLAITKDEADIGVDAIEGLLLLEANIELDDGTLGKGFYCICKTREGDKIYFDEYKITFLPRIKMLYDDNKTAQFLRAFIANLVLLIENPEIDYIPHKRTNRSNEKRVAQGKLPLPDSKVIKLTGRTKMFADELYERSGRGAPINHSFWVRGTWRKFKNVEHFRHIYAMTDEQLRENGFQWLNGVLLIKRIEPYKKGEGIEIAHKYKVEKDG